jgi:hypothetical protein
MLDPVSSKSKLKDKFTQNPETPKWFHTVKLVQWGLPSPPLCPRNAELRQLHWKSFNVWNEFGVSGFWVNFND